MSRLIVHRGSFSRFQPETLLLTSARSIPYDGTVYFSGMGQSITGIEFWEAVDACFVTLKNAYGLILGVKNLYTKVPILYDLWGGTASLTKYNICDARDLDAAFRLSWNGGVTHSSTGVAFNGTNGYGNTHLAPSSVFGSNYYGLVYSIKAYTTGVLTGTRDPSYADFDYSEINGVSLNDSFKTITGGVSTNKTSLYRPNSTQIKYKRNGTPQTISSTYAGASINPLYIGAYDAYGGPTLYSNANLDCYAVIKSPTDSEITVLENAIAQLNIDLNR